ncbi:hypothetical protein CR513_22590, partial [Mucuna pruriens]
MQKERFSTQTKYKLQLRGDGPFQVLERIDDNVYKLDLPTAYGNVNSTFHVVDLSLFIVGRIFLKRGGNDKDSTNKAKDLLCDIGGSMTWSKTKMIKQSLQGLIMEIKESLNFASF